MGPKLSSVQEISHLLVCLSGYLHVTSKKELDVGMHQV